MKLDKEATTERFCCDVRKRWAEAQEAATNIKNTDDNFSDEVSAIRASLSDLQFIIENMK